MSPSISECAAIVDGLVPRWQRRLGVEGSFPSAHLAAAPAAAALGEGATCAPDATIYDVRMPADQIGRLDVAALTAAAGAAADLEKALAQLGAVQPLYRANQSVRLAGDEITIGTTQPYISSSPSGRSGQNVNTVQYSDTGAILDISGKATTAGSLEVDLGIQLSTLCEGTTEVAPGVKAPPLPAREDVAQGNG